jgi:hypothetical protein
MDPRFEDPSEDTDLAFERAMAASDDYEPFVSQEQEDREFELGAEDMELRGMRLEAEAEARKEAALEEVDYATSCAYEDYLDATVERGTDGPVMTFEEFCSRPAAVAEPLPVCVATDDRGDDDIPF